MVHVVNVVNVVSLEKDSMEHVGNGSMHSDDFIFSQLFHSFRRILEPTHCTRVLLQCFAVGIDTLSMKPPLKTFALQAASPERHWTG